MWPVIYTFMRTNARFIIFPVAIVIGAIGYTVENMVSTKFTPYAPSIEQTRIERHTSRDALRDALDHVAEIKKPDYENVLDKQSNLSESLRRK